MSEWQKTTSCSGNVDCRYKVRFLLRAHFHVLHLAFSRSNGCWRLLSIWCRLNDPMAKFVGTQIRGSVPGSAATGRDGSFPTHRCWRISEQTDLDTMTLTMRSHWQYGD